MNPIFIAPLESLSSDLCLQLVRPDVIAALRPAASAAGVTVGDEYIYRQGNLVPFLYELMHAGGRWQPLSGPIEWTAEHTLLSPDRDQRLCSVHADVDLGGTPVPLRLWHAHGAFLLTLGDIRVVALAGEVRDGRVRWQPGVALFGRSRNEIGAFLRTASAAPPAPRLRIWGGAVREATPEPVTEEQLVLPPQLKAELLAWLDRFWRLRSKALERGLPLRRGLLLAGAPGTGKTQLIRHLLTRYPTTVAHLFIAARRGMNDDPFGDLLTLLRNETAGAIVILEDIDRLAESGVITKEYLLNALDGFLEIPVPLLWVATSNDPTLLEKNLLQRPGRFDRVIVFPLPGPEERLALLHQYSPREAQPAAWDTVVRESDGLSGAHLREACAAATLAWLDSGACYESELTRELASLRTQHAAADRLGRGLAADRGAGFRTD